MAILFPAFPDSVSTKITLRSSSADLNPHLGGPIQRVSRAGDRWLLDVDLQPMRVDQAGAIVAALVAGVGEKLLCPIKQNGLDLSGYSNGTVVGAVAGGTSLTHSGGGPAKKVGQFFSMVVGGVRYLHMITAVGGATLTFRPMLKKPLAGGEVLEFGDPKIEGFIDGNEQSWTIGRVANVGASFRILEAQ